MRKNGGFRKNGMELKVERELNHLLYLQRDLLP